MRSAGGSDSSNNNTHTEEQHQHQQQKQNNATQITKIGALTNFILAVTKGCVGYLVGSTGLIADSVNGAGDMLTDSIGRIAILYLLGTF